MRYIAVMAGGDADRRGLRSPLARLGGALVVLAMAGACDRAPAPQPHEARIEVPGGDAWLVPPEEFKAAGVRSGCKLERDTDGGAAARYFGPREGAALNDEEARALYACARPLMAEAYAQTGVAHARDYQSWTNYARAPYVSATHAERYVNNYANDVAAAYGAYEGAGPLPVGSVVAKDSFSVAEDGQVVIGPLALMEKVAGGDGAGRWTYTMIMPDGWVFGTTDGVGADNVAFCATCHGAVADAQDHLYFLPPQYRR